MSSSTDICIIIRGVSTEHIALIGEQGLGFGGESVYMIICIYFREQRRKGVGHKYKVFSVGGASEGA